MRMARSTRSMALARASKGSTRSPRPRAFRWSRPTAATAWSSSPRAQPRRRHRRLSPGLPPPPPASGRARNCGGAAPMAAESSRCPSPVGGRAAAAKNNDKDKGKAHCETSCNSQADGPSESVNDTAAPMDEDEDHVVISDDEYEVEEVTAAGKRRLTSEVWKEMKKLKINGQWKARCDYCHKMLSAAPKNGTKHLQLHLKTCTLKMLKTKGGKTLSQSSLRLNAQEDGTVSVENYSFDQEFARRELGNMLVLHEYPLAMVDHAGFRRFVHALQPLFKLHTRNTIRNDIVENYEKERKKEGN